MSRPIQSSIRATAILRLLAGGERRLGLADVATSPGLADATAHGILRTLREEGLVEQDPDSGKYQLGAELLRLGHSYLDVHELRARAQVSPCSAALARVRRSSTARRRSISSDPSSIRFPLSRAWRDLVRRSRVVSPQRWGRPGVGSRAAPSQEALPGASRATTLSFAKICNCEDSEGSRSAYLTGPKRRGVVRSVPGAGRVVPHRARCAALPPMARASAPPAGRRGCP